MISERKIPDREKWIDEALKTDPGFSLPDNFAENIARKTGRKFVWQQYVREFLVYLAVIAGIAALSVAMAFLWFDADWKQWLDFVVANAAIIAGINLLGIFVLFADRVLLRYLMYREACE